MIDKLKTELLLLKPNCLHNCKDVVKKKKLLTAPGPGCHYTSEMCPGSLYPNISGKTTSVLQVRGATIHLRCALALFILIFLVRHRYLCAPGPGCHYVPVMCPKAHEYVELYVTNITHPGLFWIYLRHRTKALALENLMDRIEYVSLSCCSSMDRSATFNHDHL